MKREANKRVASKPSRKRALWRCPKCGERFVTANRWHSCGKHTLAELFARSEPQVLSLFKKFAKIVRACGPVKTIPQKTRVVFQVRVRFAGAYPRKSYFLCSIALPRRCDDPRFIKIETYAPHFRGHFFRLASEADLDDQIQQWLNESYRVGAQEFLKERGVKNRPSFKLSNRTNSKAT